MLILLCRWERVGRGRKRVGRSKEAELVLEKVVDFGSVVSGGHT